VDWIFQWILVIGRTIGATLARARQDFKKKIHAENLKKIYSKIIRTILLRFRLRLKNLKKI